MAYYVDTGRGQFDECATLKEAREIAQHALASAQAFREKMGFVPFWGRCVEIRKGKRGLSATRPGCGGEALNQAIVTATRTHDVLYLKN